MDRTDILLASPCGQNRLVFAWSILKQELEKQIIADVAQSVM